MYPVASTHCHLDCLFPSILEVFHHVTKFPMWLQHSKNFSVFITIFQMRNKSPQVGSDLIPCSESPLPWHMEVPWGMCLPPRLSWSFSFSRDCPQSARCTLVSVLLPASKCKWFSRAPSSNSHLSSHFFTKLNCSSDHVSVSMKLPRNIVKLSEVEFYFAFRG